MNALDLTITKKRLKTLTFLKMLEILAKLEFYLKLTKYIRQYIHFYVSISRSLQNLKIALLKSKFKNDAKRKAYTSKAKLLLTQKKKTFLKHFKKQ